MMNINRYPEVHPKGKFLKKAYVAIMLWIVGRSIQAASRIDRVVKAEFAKLGDNFLLRLWVAPHGPNMLVGKDKKGRVKYMGWNPNGKKVTLEMRVKGIEQAILMFTFQESTCEATANDRLIVNGNLDDACVIVRVLDIVEVFLLPKIITKLAVKRYPKWSQMSPLRKYAGRILTYIRAFSV